MAKIGLDKGEVSIGTKVYYYSWADPDTGEHAEPQEAVITSEAFGMCGTTCCNINILSSVVSIDNLSLRQYENKRRCKINGYFW